MRAIAPDTKDWTWVLERACPECGFDTRDVTGVEVPGLLQDVTDAWREVLRSGPDPTVVAHPGKWSTLEYACHVRDVFGVFAQRLALMLDEDDPAFSNWDQDATARAARYDLQDPALVAAELDRAAAGLARRFAGLGVGDWRRTGTRSDGARFSVETLARYLIHDPVHHLFDVGWPLSPGGLGNVRGCESEMSPSPATNGPFCRRS